MKIWEGISKGEEGGVISDGRIKRSEVKFLGEESVLRIMLIVIDNE